MNRRYKVTHRKQIADTGDRKYIYPRIGTAYEDDGGHINLIISSIPVNWDGKLRLWLIDDEIDEEGDDVD